MNQFAGGFARAVKRVGSEPLTARLALSASLLLGLGVGPASAAPGAPRPVAASAPVAASGLVSNEDSADSPGVGNTRAVRLSSVEGQIQLVQNGQVIADPATANLPLFEGTQVRTGNDGRAEIQLEDGNLARLSPNSTLTLTVLQHEGTGTRTQIVLNKGLAYFELQPSNAEHSLRVSYGATSFSASSFTVVRVTLDTAPGELAVFSGNIHLDRGDALQVDVHGGESLTMDASDAGKYNVTENIEQDSWDSWNADRDQLLSSQSAERTQATIGAGGNLNSQMPGMSDLDANGNWYNVPGQGYVWSPYDAQNAGMSWDPYGFGSWVSYPGYGYIWSSGYGWGYTPYQCGLWNFYDSFGWGWVPGTSCNPWWGGYGGGGGGWGYNIGNYPHGYKPPRRPFSGPVHPRGINPRSLTGGGLQRLTSQPIVPVDRRELGKTGLLAGGGRAEPVTIAGHVVEPLSPIAPRQAYDRPASFVNGLGRPGTVYVPGASRVGTYTPTTGRVGPTYNPPGGNKSSERSGYRSAAPAPSNGGGSHYSAPAPSGGGGGGGHSGGGSAPSGGGGTHR